MEVKVVDDPNFDIRGEAIKQTSAAINEGYPFIFIAIKENEIAIVNGGANLDEFRRSIEVMHKALLTWLLTG